MLENTAYIDLLAQIDRQIERFNIKRRRHQKWYASLAVTQIVTGVAASFVLGLSLSEQHATLAKNVALLLTSVTTICTLVLAHFQYKDHFVSYTWVVGQLKQLKSEMVFRQKLEPSTGLQTSDLVNIHSKFSQILSASNADWKARNSRAVSNVDDGKVA